MPTSPVELMRADDAAHDAYFHIARIAGDAYAILVRAALSGRLLLAVEAIDPSLNTPGNPALCIDAALAALLSAFLGDNSSAAARIAVAEPGDIPELAPMARWIGGHQLFVVLTQGLIFSLQSMAFAIRAGDTEAMRRHADLSIVLLEGSAATFRFTGQFAPEEYESIIRPSMMPPAVPICLSGLMSIDHRYLVQMLRQMRPALKQMSERDPTRHQMLADALSTVYDAHIHVCARFVGEKPSIRTSESTDTSGPRLLENFRKLRLKPFERV